MKIDDNEMVGETCALLRMPQGAFFDVRADDCDLPHSNTVGDADEGRVTEPRITYISRAIIREHFRVKRALRSQHDGNRDIFSKRMYTQWMRGHKLPFHLQTNSLDVDLEQKLNALPREYQRVAVGSHVLLIEIATRRIVDVMRDVYAS